MQQHVMTAGPWPYAREQSEILADLDELTGPARPVGEVLRDCALLFVRSFADGCLILGEDPSGNDEGPVVATHRDPRMHARLEELARRPEWLEPLVELCDALPEAPCALHALVLGDLFEQPSTLCDGVRQLGPVVVLHVCLGAFGVKLGSLLLVRATGGFGRQDLERAEELARRLVYGIDGANRRELIESAARAQQDRLAMVAHDLRAPLSTIGLTAERMSRADALTPAMRADSEAILRNVRRMERLVKDLLDSSKIQSGSFRLDSARCGLAPILQQALVAARPLAEEHGLTLRLYDEGVPLEVLCDCERVLQVLDNLIGNAIKFTPEGGFVTLRAEARDDEVVILVEDNGVGMSPRQLPRVFDRYWQGRGVSATRSQHHGGPGLGLGLHIARGLVQSQGGRIWAESQNGEGSRFFFTLPRA